MLPIMINLCLAVLKFVAGGLCGLSSVMADAANNLMDAVTSTFIEIGTKISALPGGRKHKNGHGKIEWLVAIVVSCSIVLVGWELLGNSIENIKNPTYVSFNVVTLIILIASIATKVFLFGFNTKKSKENNSQAYKAIAADCISDAVSTGMVTVCYLIQIITNVNLDGWCGVIVSIFIMYNGLKSFVDTAKRILGEPTNENAADDMRNFILEAGKEWIHSCEDVQLIDYGYERYSLTANVVARNDIAGDAILDNLTNLKSAIYRKYGYIATIQVERNLEAGSDQIIEYIKKKLSDCSCELSVEENTRINRAGDRVQILLYVSTCFENGKKEPEIMNELGNMEIPDYWDVIIKLSMKRKERNFHHCRRK